MDAHGVILRQQANLYAWAGVTLAFTHPKTRKPSSLTAVYNDQAHATQGLSVQIQTDRPQYKVRAADVAALGLAQTDFDGLTVTVEGMTGRVSSTASLPGHVAAAAEIGLNLIGLT